MRNVERNRMERVSSKTARDKTKETKQEITKERLCGREREGGNETLMETDRRESCCETRRQDANMMSSSFC